jgi:hypothetical protein
VLIHKECGGRALEESPVGEVCAIPIDRFPFTGLEEIVDEPKLQLEEAPGYLIDKKSCIFSQAQVVKCYAERSAFPIARAVG